MRQVSRLPSTPYEGTSSDQLGGDSEVRTQLDIAGVNQERKAR